MTASRVATQPWRGIVMPNQMRVIEGRDVQYESETMFRTTRAMATEFTLRQIYETSSFMTDDYRAILPIGTAAAATNLLGSWYWGSVASDVIWWWGGACATASLTGVLGGGKTASFIAGVLASASPLGVGYIGSGNLHAASSMSLPIFLVLAWRVVDHRELHLIARGVSLGLIGFLSSVTYTYQWVVFPLVGAYALRPSAAHWRIPMLVGLATFFAVTAVVKATLARVGLAVSAHMNDPWLVISGRFAGFGIEAIPSRLAAESIHLGQVAVDTA
jgi:hypothetical protein